MTGRQKAVFLDRDGVINVDRSDYVKSIEEFVFEDGVKTALARLTQASWPVFVISNQACVGKGIITTEDLQKITNCYVSEIVTHGGRINQVYYCHHTSENNCECRKPKPGLLHQAAHDHAIDLQKSYFIGDSARDILAGQAAGCQTVLLLSGHGRKSLKECQEQGITPDFICATLTEAVQKIGPYI